MAIIQKCVIASSRGDNTTEIFFIMLEFLRSAAMPWIPPGPKTSYVLLIVRIVNFIDKEYSAKLGVYSGPMTLA